MAITIFYILLLICCALFSNIDYGVQRNWKRYVSFDSEKKYRKFSNRYCSLLIGNELELKSLKHPNKNKIIRTKGITRKQKETVLKYLMQSFDYYTTYKTLYKVLQDNRINLEIISEFNKIKPKRKIFENDYCCIKLSDTKDIITVVEKNQGNKHRILTCTGCKEKTVFLVWNTISSQFFHLSDYESVKNLFNRKDFQIEVREQYIYDERQIKKLTDINNCTEKELRALPGINIIYAKRIIKRREEIGGFKDKKEFFGYIKVTDKIRDKLTKLICFNKFKEEKKAQKTKERNIDL